MVKGLFGIRSESLEFVSQYYRETKRIHDERLINILKNCIINIFVDLQMVVSRRESQGARLQTE